MENHVHVVALHTMYYYFGHVHKTLLVTPAMEAGVSSVSNALVPVSCCRFLPLFFPFLPISSRFAPLRLMFDSAQLFESLFRKKVVAEEERLAYGYIITEEPKKMNRQDQAHVDARIAQIRQAILKLQGELEGLEFAKRYMTREPAAPVGKGQAKSSPKAKKAVSRNASSGQLVFVPPVQQTSVRQLALETVKAHPQGITYREICNLASAKAGKPLNLKTVSSSLDVLKKGGQVKLDGNGLYKPGA